MIYYYSPNLSIYKIFRSLFVFKSKKKLKQYFQDQTGKKYILFTNSCRSALYLSYKALGVNGNVITSPLTCTAALDPIIHSGNLPQFIDIDPESLNINCDLLDSQNLDGVIAVQAIHHGGIPNDMGKLSRFIEKKKIILIEDCAQAFGAKYKGGNVGSFGAVACFSLIKNAYSVGGGILSTDDKNIYEKAKLIQDTFSKVSKWLLVYRIIRGTLETNRNNLVGKAVYEKFMCSRDLFLGKQDDNKFTKELKKPHSLLFKIASMQMENWAGLHNQRIKKARMLIKYGENKKIFSNSFNNIDSNSYTKLFFVIEKLQSEKHIKKIYKKGVECQHLNHKYNSFYQKRLDNNPLYKDIPSLYKCQNYLKLHDRIVSVPLFEDLKGHQCAKIINTISEVINEN